MSIYSGFGTRKLEHQYNKTLYGLLLLLQTRVFEELYGDQDAKKSLDKDSFLAAFRKLLGRLVMMEDRKHLPPKLSQSCADLAKATGTTEWMNRSLYKEESDNETLQE